MVERSKQRREKKGDFEISDLGFHMPARMMVLVLVHAEFVPRPAVPLSPPQPFACVWCVCPYTH